MAVLNVIPVVIMGGVPIGDMYSTKGIFHFIWRKSVIWASAKWRLLGFNTAYCTAFVVPAVVSSSIFIFQVAGISS